MRKYVVQINGCNKEADVTAERFSICEGYLRFHEKAQDAGINEEPADTLTTVFVPGHWVSVQLACWKF